VRRRELVLGIGGAIFLPLAVRAQQPKEPIVGVLFGGSATLLKATFSAFLTGLGEFGYRDGKNVTIQYRTAEGRYERLPALVSETVSSTVPVVFAIAADPVALGLVASLNRPAAILPVRRSSASSLRRSSSNCCTNSVPMPEQSAS